MSDTVEMCTRADYEKMETGLWYQMYTHRIRDGLLLCFLEFMLALMLAVSLAFNITTVLKCIELRKSETEWKK